MADYPDLFSQHILIEFHVFEQMVNNLELSLMDTQVHIHQLTEIVNLLTLQQIFQLMMRRLVILEIFYFHPILNQMKEIQR